MKVEFPVYRFDASHGSVVELYYVNSSDQLRRVDSSVELPEREFKIPAVLIVGRLGIKLWADILSAANLGLPMLCLSLEAARGTICVGLGRDLRAYDVSTGAHQINIQTNYIIQNIIQPGATLSGSVIVVTELAAARYSAQGKLLWEYWHHEPIESSWMDQSELHLIDLEKGAVSICAESGRVK